jgi:hypothetical protein
MANFRTATVALALAATMAGTQAMAADGALAPGKPAGVTQARLRHHGPNLLLIGGAAALAVVGIVVGTLNSNNSVCGVAQGCVPIGGGSTSTATN